ncbi:MAG TPA: TonB-dependent receptor [Steroidobacteraceae bacterium]|nr:TonB-dependent receptor [Steroidobacteraceae bacterium]
MNRHSARTALTVSGSVAMVLAAAAAGAEDAPTRLGEVTVTAQKRVEALADIPMSVSVLDGDTLARQQADSFQDLASLIPGLSLNSNSRGVTRVTMRGINTGGVASTIGVYVNDVPFGSSSGLANAAILSGDFDTFDMARIEVLRGPQGTLYGASALGGVIKYVANQPSTAGFEVRAQGSVEDVSGGEMGYALTGVVNVPMSDTVALRASGFHRSDGGYTRSIGNNPIPALQDPSVNIIDGTLVRDELNGSEVTGGRFSTLFRPSDSFSLDLAVHYQEISNDNSSVFEVDPMTFSPLYGGRVASRYHHEPADIEYRLYSATLDWAIGGVALQSVTSYSEFSHDFRLDAAVVDILGTGLGTAQLMTLFYSTPGTTDMLLSGVLDQLTATDKFTQEFRLVSPASDTFEWLLGAYYADEDSVIHQRAIAVEPGTGSPVASVPALADLSLTSAYQELAVFGNATWHVTDRFDLSFGARWSDNDQDAAQNALIILPILPGGQLALDFEDLKSSESPVTWSFSPRYEFNDRTSAYLRVATGFRPGGPNVLPPGAPAPASYDSDELTNYELGLRTGNASGSFSLDVAAFFLDWEDIQLLQVVNGFGINANGGTAESRGLEFTATARSGGLSLTFSGAYTDAELTEDTDPLVGGFDGDALPFVPEWTLALGGDYEWSAFGDATAYVGGQVAYTGDRPAGFGNRIDPMDPTSPRREAGSYTTVDLRAGVLWQNWSLELYGKNVTDEDGITDIIAPGIFPNGAGALSLIRPRTLGLAFGLRF